MKKFQTITAADLPALLSNDTPLLLDCRSLKDYKTGHMENAMHAHDGLVEALISKGDRERTMVIYCYHGHSSEHLAELFGVNGFLQVYSVNGGYDSWKQAGN